MDKIKKIISECFESINSQRHSNKQTFSNNYLRATIRGICYNNNILLNRKQRDYVLNRLALKVNKIDSDLKNLKSFKVLIEVQAYDEADMREIVEQANDSQIEWWVKCD